MTCPLPLDGSGGTRLQGFCKRRATSALADFYQFVLLGNLGSPALTEKDVFELARKNHDGPLLIGEDLMAFRIDRDAVVPLASAVMLPTRMSSAPSKPFVLRG